jgi:hypothetical protein
MKNCFKTYCLIILASLSSFPGVSWAAAPLHDVATRALELTGPLITAPTVDLTEATAAATDPMINGASAGKTVWYKVPRAKNASKLFCFAEITSLTGSGKMSLYRQRDPENPLTSLIDPFSAIAPVSFSPGQSVSLNFEITDNDDNPHMLMVSGTGTVSLRFRSSFVQNDFPMTAIVLPEGIRGSTYGNNRLATDSSDEPNGYAYKVWYKWTPTFTGAAAVDTNFSFNAYSEGGSDPANHHHTSLRLYQGTSPGTLTLITSDESSGWGSNSRITFSATAGTTYYICVGTRTESDGFSFTTKPGGFNLNYYRANTAGEISFYSGDSLGEAYGNQGSRSFWVIRKYAGDFAVNCSLASVPAKSTATAGADYQAISTTVSFTNPNAFADSAWMYNGTIQLLDDNVSEPLETLSLLISGAPLTAIITGPETTLRVLDKDDKGADYLHVVTPELRVSESTYWIYVGLIYKVEQSRNFGIMSGSGAGQAEFGIEYNISNTFLDQTKNYTQAVISHYDDRVFESDEENSVTLKMGNYAPHFKVIIEDDDPYIPQAGRLCAAFTYGNVSRHAQCIAEMTTSGVVTGKLTLATGSISFRTILDQRGRAQVLIPIVGRPALHLTIQATDATGGFRLTLLDSLTQGLSGADVVLQNYNAKTYPCPEAGRYTLAASKYGTATVEVSPTGAAKVAATLFDGTKAALSGFIDGDGRLNVSLPLYAGKGAIGISGYLPGLNSQPSNIGLSVVRPALHGSPTALGYLNDYTSMSAVRYTPASKAINCLEAWSAGTGKATLKDGPLMNTIMKNLTVAAGITSLADAEKLKISLLPATGVFTGSFVPPGATKPLPFTGVLSQLTGANGYGMGLFFDGLKTGTIQIGKP